MPTMQTGIRRGRDRFIHKTGVGFLAVVLGITGLLTHAPVTQAIDDSITIDSATITLRTDNDSNNKANIGDVVRLTVHVTNDDGGYVDVGTVVEADMSAYGGSVDEDVPGVTDNGGTSDVFRLDFTITDAGVDGIDVAASDDASKVTVTAYDDDELDGAGAPNPTLVSGAVAKPVDTVSPVITSSNLVIDNGDCSGTGGVCIPEDVIVFTWNNGEGGDTNIDIDSVEADVSDFGGSSSATMYDDGVSGGDDTAADGIWTTVLEVPTGNNDGTYGFSVRAYDDADNDSGWVSSVAETAVDNQSPTVTAGAISISGNNTEYDDSFVEFDTVSVTWNASGEGGDNNADTISSVTVDFTDFGGGVAVAATDNEDGTWTATYVMGSGSIDDPSVNVSVTANDNAGNETTTTGTNNVSVDNEDPISTQEKLTVDDSACTGTGGTCMVGDVITFTWNGAGEGGDGNTDTLIDVSADLTEFGGGGYVTMYDDGENGGDDVADDGIWTIQRTITEGSEDDATAAFAITVTDNAGNNENTVFSSSTASIDDESPTVTASNIDVDTSDCSGTDSTCIVGDQLVFTWNNGEGGDNNTDDLADILIDVIDFGGGVDEIMYDDGVGGGDDTAADGIWTFTMTLSSNTNDGNYAPTLFVTDDAGNETGRTSDQEVDVDNEPPTVTNGNISISGASGTGGAYKIGDTVTATWDDTAEGDNNTDTISSVTVDFSAFGGEPDAAATNSSGTWTATYTISGVEDVDTTNVNISVTATDDAGNAITTADTSNATVDTTAPTVSNGNISISGASGTGGAYKIGDTVTATWDDTAEGDNNSDTISAVTVNFTQFGGGSSVSASNSSGTWTATYTIVAGSVDTTNRNVSVTATDNAGNTTTTADTSNATVDNVRPTITTAAIVDSNANGIIDGLSLDFSEGIATAAAGANGFNVTSAEDHGSCTSESITPNASASRTLTFTCTVVDTAVDDLNLVFTASGTMVDDAGNQMSSITLTSVSSPAITDGADPVLLSVSPEDGETSVERDASLVLTFSEAMENAFEKGIQFTTDPSEDNWDAILDDSEREVTLTHTTFACETEVSVTLDFDEISSNESESVNGAGPEDNAWSFTTVDCRRSSGGGGGGGGTSSTAASVDFTLPESNDVLQSGYTTSITWTTSSSSIKTVKLQYSLNGGSTWSTIVNSVTASEKSYDWDIPASLSSDNGKIKITAYDSGKGELDIDTVTVSFNSTTSSNDASGTTEGDTSGLSRDADGHLVAPESDSKGASPYDGSTEIISEVEEGWFVRAEHYNTVYYVNGAGERRVFWDTNTFFTWADAWDDIVWVTDATLATMPLGQPMLPKAEVVLVKIQSDANVYAIEDSGNGYDLRLIPNEATAIALYGSSWADYVIDVDPTIFAKFDMGSEMSTNDDVNTANMRTRVKLATLAAAE